MNKVAPIYVNHLFEEMLDALLMLLRSLPDDDWQKPTACAGWTVKDVALHLLGGDIGIVSRERDEFAPERQNINSWADLVAFIDRANDIWLQSTRRISPRLLCDLLEFTGRQAIAHFNTLDLRSIGNPVSWAGDEPAPVWLDIAREYTERWHHQQHIRDAIGQPGLKEPRFLAPALDTFIRALPHTLHTVYAAEGATLSFQISGESGGEWFLLRETPAWSLYVCDDAQDTQSGATAQVRIHEDAAWRLFTKGLPKDDIMAHVSIDGQQALAHAMLKTVAIIA
ncbi:MAG: maleylpyruvate isomerase family mycothiol-dependent enzyme [Chloroflexota bacterium]